MILGLMAAASCAVSWACGACDEDKIAATYDHAVVDRATARHDQLLVVAIDGSVSPEQVARQITAAAPKVRGVVTGTLRTSLSPAAFSFALDRRQRPEDAVSNFQKAVGDRGARLTLVRVLRDGTWVSAD
jgi:hypothetical protein